MKCIYCNSDQQLTVSDIITFAITGAKLTKSFVCKKHNAFTNDNYEKKFVADLDCFRNHLGLTTRDGKPIQYRADIIVDGVEMLDVKMSTNEALFAPKGVVSGVDKQGKKVIMGPMEKIERISNGKGQKVNISDITWRKKFNSDCFFGFYAMHSIAKIAYEWYCYNNNIEEYKEENNEIVKYILNEIDGDYVGVIVDGNYYYCIDQLSEIGTNSFFQYDDVDGYRYVVFDFWKVIAYRVRVCKSPDNITQNDNSIMFNLFRYHIDGRKTKTVFGRYNPDFVQKPKFHTMKIQELMQESNIYLCKEFVKRIEEIMTTIIFSIYTLKEEVDTLSDNLKKYDEGKNDIIHLLEFEEYRTVFTIEIISQLYTNKEKYDMTKSFNNNIDVVLEGQTLQRTLEDKKQFVKVLSLKDKRSELSKYLWDIISFFYKIFENEMNLSQ